MRLPLLLAAALAVAACGPAIGAPADDEPHPEMSVEVDAGPDSLFHAVQARLLALGYRVDQADAAGHRLVVRPPDDETRVEILIQAQGSASRVSTAPAGGGDAAAQMRALLTVMHDVAIEPASPRDAHDAALGGLPDSRWITEFFLSPRGRLWSARTGLFTADSLFGRWTRSFGGPGDPVDPDNLRVDATLGFVSEQVMLLGIDVMGENLPVLFRTADGGASWSAVPVGAFENVSAIAAVGPSAWAFATQLENEERLTVFLRSADGGKTWERAALPTGVDYVTDLYRVSPDTAYLAIAGFDPGPVFWRTTDGGDHWEPVPTPHDQGLHRVPDYGVHVEEIATVGDHLVVREYGRVFSTRTDSIRWRAMNGIEHVAADRARDRLFILTDGLEPAMLDRKFGLVWRGDRRIPRTKPSEVEAIAAFDGTGYVVMLQGEIYEVRDGTVRLRQPDR